MKTKLKFLCLFVIIIASFTFYSCEKDQLGEQRSQVVFGFDKLVNEEVTEQKSADVSSVIVSIADETGKLIYNLKEVELDIINGSYKSKALSLVEGDYSLTRFIVIDSQGNALDVSPVSGSPNDYLANNPLPIDFNVNISNVTQVVPEVIEVYGSEPQDFGYSTFYFNVVKTFDFYMGVYIYDPVKQDTVPTDAKLIVETDEGMYLNSVLESRDNVITLSSKIDNYTLNVEKDGYLTYTKAFKTSDLMLYTNSYYYGQDYNNSTNNEPLKVVLSPDTDIIKSFSFRTDQSTLKQIQFQIGQDCMADSDIDSSNTFRINWGNGYPQTISIGSSKLVTYNYKEQGNFPIKVEGKLNDICKLSLAESNITEVNISEVVNLSIFESNSNLLQNIDVSKNLQLETLRLNDNELADLDISLNNDLKALYVLKNNLTSLDMYKNTQLKIVHCDSNQISSIKVSNDNVITNLSARHNKLNTKELDNLLVNMKESVIASPRRGFLNIEGNDVISSTGREAKEVLENSYYWVITTD